MTSVLAVYNQALGLAGARAKLASLGDKSRERELCDLYYDTAKSTAFSMANWPDLSATARLAIVAERNFALDWADGDPQPPWRFAYALPHDYVRARHLSSGARFKLGNCNGERVLLTNQEQAVLIYTRNIESPGAWDNSLRKVVVAELALKIVGGLSFSDNAAANVAQHYGKEVTDALLEQANEAHRYMPEQDPISSSFYTMAPDVPASVKGYMGQV